MDILGSTVGLSCEGINLATLQREIDTLTTTHGLSNADELCDALLKKDELLYSLVSRLTVNETFFFREKTFIDLFRDFIIPSVMRRKLAGRKIRVLSAGCSTGEEPYTLAMALMESTGSDIRKSFDILGVDIDQEALEICKKGVYGKMSFRSIQERIKAKYFSRISGDEYAINPEVRNSVSFCHQNLLGDDYCEDIMGVDVIFYRNVSIYFNTLAQRKIFDKLSNALNEGGFIVVASSETISHDLGILPMIQKDNMFLYQKRHGELGQGKTVSTGLGYKLPLTPKVEDTPCSTKTVPAKKPENTNVEIINEAQVDLKALYEAAFTLYKKKSYSAALEVLDELLAHDPEHTDALLMKSSIMLSLGRHAEAQQICIDALNVDNLQLEAYLLLASVRSMDGKHDDAIKALKQAIYVSPDCGLAYFLLAQQYERIGELTMASSGYKKTIKALDGREGFMQLRFFEINFGADQIIHLCQSKVASLSGGSGGN
jgi:chemotaxis protein methyltransferase CheR